MCVFCHWSQRPCVWVSSRESFMFPFAILVRHPEWWLQQSCGDYLRAILSDMDTDSDVKCTLCVTGTILGVTRPQRLHCLCQAFILLRCPVSFSLGCSVFTYHPCFPAGRFLTWCRADWNSQTVVLPLTTKAFVFDRWSPFSLSRIRLFCARYTKSRQWHGLASWSVTGRISALVFMRQLQKSNFYFI